MTEQEWLACDYNDMYRMCQFVNGNDRKSRLFAVACCREIWDKFTDEKSKNAVEVAEQFADGLANEEELFFARMLADDYVVFTLNISNKSCNDIANAAWHVTCPSRYSINYAFYVAEFSINKRGVALLRNIVNPFHKSLTPSEQARNFANVIYKSKDWQALTVLADMLEDEGCTDTILLNHLRTKDQVYRGWWSLDVIRGF